MANIRISQGGSHDFWFLSLCLCVFLSLCLFVFCLFVTWDRNAEVLQKGWSRGGSHDFWLMLRPADRHHSMAPPPIMSQSHWRKIWQEQSRGRRGSSGRFCNLLLSSLLVVVALSSFISAIWLVLLGHKKVAHFHQCRKKLNWRYFAGLDGFVLGCL